MPKTKKDNELKPLELEEVTLIFKNFSGKKTEFNERGNRLFSVLIEEVPFAIHLRDLGWNIRDLTQEDEAPAYHLPVKVNFNSNYPPRIFLIRNGKLIGLTEQTVAMLDYSRIISADVQINPYNWTVRGETGVSAYLSAMYITVESSRFDDKYEDLPVQ